MEHIELLIALHRDALRQGPGGEAETRRAIELSGMANGRGWKIADIGCGTGASTFVLAQELDATITAVDLLPDFLSVLQNRAERLGVAHRITPLAVSMDALPFAPASLDAIWSEGAIYQMGLEKGVREWRKFLRPGGILAISELTWLTAQRPPELEAHWRAEYPEVDTAASKMAVLERNGYSPLGYFVLPESCWIDAYYKPMQQRFAPFLSTYGTSEVAQAIVETERREIALYERYRAFFGYGYYIARSVGKPLR